MKWEPHLPGDENKGDNVRKPQVKSGGHSSISVDVLGTDKKVQKHQRSDSGVSQPQVLEELSGDAAEAFGVDFLPQEATEQKQFYKDRHSYVITEDKTE